MSLDALGHFWTFIDYIVCFSMFLAAFECFKMFWYTFLYFCTFVRLYFRMFCDVLGCFGIFWGIKKKMELLLLKW